MNYGRLKKSSNQGSRPPVAKKRTSKIDVYGASAGANASGNQSK